MDASIPCCCMSGCRPHVHEKNGVLVQVLLAGAALVVLLPIRATRILVAITMQGLASELALVAVMEKTKISKGSTGFDLVAEMLI